MSLNALSQLLSKRKKFQVLTQRKQIVRVRKEESKMEASSPPVVAKRLWKVVRIVYFMLRKGISKRKLMVDVHMMMKRGKIAGKKAIGSLMFHHHHHHPNDSNDRTTDVHLSRSHPFFAPTEYEFSCSNSPAFPFFATTHKRKTHHSHHNYFSCIHPSSSDDDISALHKALEILNSEMSSTAVSPVSVLPGFGKSPMVRQLRITDSPFPLRDGTDENGQVDKEAEEFIERFYEQLRLQKQMATYQEMLTAG